MSRRLFVMMACLMISPATVLANHDNEETEVLTCGPECITQMMNGELPLEVILEGCDNPEIIIETYMEYGMMVMAMDIYCDEPNTSDAVPNS